VLFWTAEVPESPTASQEEDDEVTKGFILPQKSTASPASYTPAKVVLSDRF